MCLSVATTEAINPKVWAAVKARFGFAAHQSGEGDRLVTWYWLSTTALQPFGGWAFMGAKGPAEGRWLPGQKPSCRHQDAATVSAIGVVSQLAAAPVY